MTRDALPVLDLADLDAGPEAQERFREQLRVATREVGFFHLRHGIDRAVVDELFDLKAMVTEEFLADPDTLESMFLDVGRREFAFIRRSRRAPWAAMLT